MLIWAIVASGLVSAFLWKKANPGKSLNPTKDAAEDGALASNTQPRQSARP